MSGPFGACGRESPQYAFLPAACVDDDDNTRGFTADKQAEEGVFARGRAAQQRPATSIPPDDGIAEVPVVRTLLVSTLVRHAVAQAKDPFRANALCCQLHRRGARDALVALGRLACASKGYHEEVYASYHVDFLLAGVAGPDWREWSPSTDAAHPLLGTPSSHRPSLGTLHRLLKFEADLPLVIRKNAAYSSTFAASRHVPLLRPAVVFLPPPEALAGWSPPPSKKTDGLAIKATKCTAHSIHTARMRRVAQESLELAEAAHADALAALSTSAAEDGAVVTAELEAVARAMMDACSLRETAAADVGVIVPLSSSILGDGGDEVRPDVEVAALPVDASRSSVAATKQLLVTFEKVKSDADVAFHLAEAESVQARVELAESEAKDALREPHLTHPASSPGERGVFPPTKVGGSIDWPWHDEKRCNMDGNPVMQPNCQEFFSGSLEFLAQINLEQVTSGCAFLPPGLLPTAGILYFFISAGFEEDLNPGIVPEGEDPLNPVWRRKCYVWHYQPDDDSPSWPKPLPHGALHPVARHRYPYTHIFGAMRTSMETYRSSAPAAAADVLTAPSFPRHDMMSAKWRRVLYPSDVAHLYGNIANLYDEEEQEEDDEMRSSDYVEAECTYVNRVRAMAAVPCHVPMMLGHFSIPEHAFWGLWGDAYVAPDESPLRDMYDQDKICLLQVMPQGPEECVVAFFATKAELLRRDWGAVEVIVIPGQSIHVKHLE